MAVFQPLQVLTVRQRRFALFSLFVATAIVFSWFLLLSNRLGLPNNASRPIELLGGGGEVGDMGEPGGIAHGIAQSEIGQPEGQEAPLEEEEVEVEKSPYFDWKTKSSFKPVSLNADHASVEDLCRSFPHYRIDWDIQPVLKMGHSEMGGAKAQAQFDSVSRCIDDLLVFSDRNETAHGRTAIDVIDDLPASYFVDNPELVKYSQVREALSQGTVDDEDALPHLDGWMLDKYKFLPMVERAWRMRPDKRWYIFYEADTYVVWDNIFRVIDHLNPDKPHYIGSASPGRTTESGEETWFANGGPGFMFSRAAMKQLLSSSSGSEGGEGGSLAKQWEDLMRADCCGDSVLGFAVHAAGIQHSNLWPLWNVEPLHRMYFKPPQFWCQPVLTMHRTRPEDMVDLWRWEHGRRTTGTPLLYRDLFDYYLGRRDLMSAAQKPDWDNCCIDDWRDPRAGSFEECGRACADDPTCLQYRWHNRECVLMRSALYGNPRGAVPPPPSKLPEEEEEQPPWDFEAARFMSGWQTGRIEALSRETCDVIRWERPSLSRIY